MMRFYLLEQDGSTFVTFLESAIDVKYLAELNGIGSGSFKLAPNDPKAALIAAHQIVRVQIGNTIIGHWLIRDINETIIDDGGNDGGMDVSGPGVLALLDRSVLRCNPSDTGAKVGFTSYGADWLIEAYADLPFGYNWTALLDSNGNAWPEWPDAGGFQASFTGNSSMLAVMQSAIGFGIDQWLDPATLNMAACPAPKGDDLTATVIMRQGRDIQKLTRARSGSDLANMLFSIEGTASYNDYTNAASVAIYGELETGVDLSGTGTYTDMAIRAQALIDELAVPLESISMSLNTVTFMPFQHYSLGDTIRVVAATMTFDFRITALLLYEKNGDIVVDLQSDNIVNVAKTFLERVNQQLTFTLAQLHHAQE